MKKRLKFTFQQVPYHSPLTISGIIADIFLLEFSRLSPPHPQLFFQLLVYLFKTCLKCPEFNTQQLVYAYILKTDTILESFFILLPSQQSQTLKLF